MGTHIRIQYKGNTISIRKLAILLNINYNTLLSKKNRSNKDYISILKEDYNVNIEKIGKLYYYRM